MKLENYKNNEKYKQKVGIKNTKDLSYLDYIEKKIKGDSICYNIIQIW